jgi:hypothetical protein
MLETFKAELPDCNFEKILLVTAHQRNRLSSIKGAMPATLAFGYVPSEGGAMDNPDFEFSRSSSTRHRLPQDESRSCLRSCCPSSLTC